MAEQAIPIMKQKEKIISNFNISEGENVSEIQSLTTRISYLSQSSDFWNTWMLWTLVFAFVAAGAVAFITRMSIVCAKQLAEAQDELISAKGRQLSFDLRDKDVKISKANDDAAHANERAATAIERSALLEKDAAQARLETEQIKEKTSWRKLTDEQKQLFIASLGNARFKVEIRFEEGDVETKTYAHAIRMMITGTNLEDAGVTITKSGVSPTMPGINIVCDVPDELEKLVDAFSAAGIKVIPFKHRWPGFPPYPVITIGSRWPLDFVPHIPAKE